MTAGGLSGTLSWVVTYPFDVVKSRLQADGMGGEIKYRGIWHCFKNSIEVEGISVMSRGLISTIVRAFPTNAATFTVVSWVMKAGEELEKNLGDGQALRDLIFQGEMLVTNAYYHEYISF